MAEFLSLLKIFFSVGLLFGFLMLASRKSRRRGWQLVFVGLVGAVACNFVQGIPADRAARSAGFESSSDQVAARKRGITEPQDWLKTKAAEEASRREAEAASAKRAASERAAQEKKEAEAEAKPHLVPYDRATNFNYRLMMQSAMDDIKGRLRDPDSVKFRNVYLNGPTGVIVTCGEVNAKNGFGGFAGFERFISNGGGITAMPPDFEDSSEFRKLWRKFCL